MEKKSNPFAWSPGPVEHDWRAWTRKQLGKRERLACEACGSTTAMGVMRLCLKCCTAMSLCCNDPLILRRLADYLEHRDGKEKARQDGQGDGRI